MSSHNVPGSDENRMHTELQVLLNWLIDQGGMVSKWDDGTTYDIPKVSDGTMHDASRLGYIKIVYTPNLTIELHVTDYGRRALGQNIPFSYIEKIERLIIKQVRRLMIS